MSTRMVKIERQITSVGRNVKTEITTFHSWECNMIQPLWKTGNFFKI